MDEPLNREVTVKQLISSFITPNDSTYNRNHGPIPNLSADTHKVTIDGCVSNPLTLSVSDLHSEFPQHEVLAAMQCAGNRRHTMHTLLREVQGVDWKDGAVMNCVWKGPRLRDVLNKADVKFERGSQVAFSCYKQKCQEDDWYGGSLDLKRCMGIDMEVILALEVNGHPLSTQHGHPVRVVIPGVIGARWVKWLDRITVQQEESTNHYQRRDYKVLPPEATDSVIAEDYWDRVPAMSETPINSVIAVPGENEIIELLPSGMIEVRGYALPQGHHGPVKTVEVSIDGGQSWVNADLERGCPGKAGQQSRWSWVLWTATISAINKGARRDIRSRATDAGGNTQKEEHSPWNLRGVGYNGYGAVRNLTII